MQKNNQAENKGQERSAPRTRPKKQNKAQQKPKNRKQRQRPQAERKPYKLIVPTSVSADNSYSVAIKTEIDLDTFKTMLFSLASWVLQTGINGNQRASDIGFTTIWSGFDYMLSGMWSEVQGGTLVLNTRPRVIHDIIVALVNKTIVVRGSKFQYSWSVPENATMAPIRTTQYGPVNYFTVSSGGSTINDYASTNFAVFSGTGTLQDYTKLLKYLDSLDNEFLKTVGAEHKSHLKNDVSCRARVYSYCGLRPTLSSGWATSCENELPIIRPVFSKFVPYNDNLEDARIPTQLVPSGGDPATMLGLLFTKHFGPLDHAYENRCCPKFIPVDFESFYDALCLWMVKLKTAAYFQSNDPSIATSSLPFSQQDFRVALMQALKGVFAESIAATQFVGPIQYNQDGNAFVPTTCGGNNFANVEFARTMLVPELIQENANALKSRSVMSSSPKAKHAAVYCPILGRWYLDTPASYTFQGQGEEGPVPLFTALVQDGINILDGSVGNVPIDCNGPYYKKVISDWNEHVEALKNFSSSVEPLLGDKGPMGLPLILFTASERVTPIEPNTPSAKKSTPPLIDRFVANVTPIKKEKLENKRVSVTYIPAATTPQLDLQNIYTMVPNPRPEIISLVENLITPSIRFNPTQLSGDVLNSEMYQVHTRMNNAVPLGSLYDVQTQTKYEKLNRLAGMCITGIGRDSTDVYTQIMATLRDEGQASGLLSLLAGVVGTIIPPLAPVANMVAQAIEK